jgi:predicted dehydrogenase
MKKIVLVGSGELGSRHLQALALADVPVTVHVVDPSDAALDLAKLRCEQVTPALEAFEVHYHTSIAELGGDVDVAIIATTSNVRLRVLEQLENTVALHNVVLEKFLFSHESEFERAAELIAAMPGGAWVNCPRRMYPVYQALKSELPLSKPVAYRVVGPDWGLACNSVHYLDHLAYLTGETLVSTSIDSKTATAIDSKRSGYQEFLGEVRGEFSGGSTISLSAGSSETKSLMTIQNSDFELSVDEIGRKYTLANRQTGTTETQEFAIPFQSQLSHVFAKEIMESGTCDLPTFEESQTFHLSLLQSFARLHDELGGATRGPLRIT